MSGCFSDCLLLPRRKPFLCQGVSLSSAAQADWPVVPSAQGTRPSRGLNSEALRKAGEAGGGSGADLEVGM